MFHTRISLITPLPNLTTLSLDSISQISYLNITYNMCDLTIQGKILLTKVINLRSGEGYPYKLLYSNNARVL
jgi:hypothetical protein